MNKFNSRLDIQIAKRIMGLTLRRGEVSHRYYLKFEVSPYLNIPVRRYSTNINDAWLVVVKLTGKGLGFALNRVGTRKGLYRCMFGRTGLKYDHNPARAICLAALACKEIP